MIKGLWRLNGDANDASGNNYNGTNTSVTFGQGVKNQCASYNGTSSRTQINATIGAKNGDKTILCWTKFLSDLSVDSWHMLLQLQYDNVNYGFEHDRITGVSYFRALRSRNFVGNDPIAFSSPVAGKWYYLALTFSGSTMKFYVNSVLVDSITVSTADGTGSNGYNVTFGDLTSTGGHSYYAGNVDDVSIDDSVWSPAKIKNEYASVKGFF